MKKYLSYAAIAVAMAAAGNVMAHGAQAKHGGIVQTASDISFELVNKDGKTLIYVEDHGKKVPTAGASGKLIVLQGTEKNEIVLEPAGENTLQAQTGAALAQGSKAIAKISLPGKEAVNVRFALKP